MIRFTEPVRKATAPKLPPLTAAERTVRDSLLAAVQRIKDRSVARAITEALERNDVAGAVELVRFDMGEEFLRSSLPLQFRKAYEIEAGAAVKYIETATGFSLGFDYLAPEIIQWISKNVADLIREWGASSRAAIRDAIVRAYEKRISAATIARQIKDVGLTERLQRAVDRYREMLEARGYAADKVARMTERYYKRLLRYRTEMIARTELKRANIAAQQEVWRQAIAKGIIDPSSMEQEWVATAGDPRVCDDCSDLDGTRAPFGGTFVAEGGADGGLGPPEHPQCRCVLVLVERGKPSRGRTRRLNIPGDRGIRPIRTLRP